MYKLVQKIKEFFVPKKVVEITPEMRAELRRKHCHRCNERKVK